MRNNDEKLYTILKEDTMIPGKVERAIQEAYTQLENGEVKRKSSTYVSPKRRFRTAAAIGIVTLAIGTTAYAAATGQSAILNSLSMFGKTLPEPAESLIETEIAQQKADNDIVNFSVREALCDKNTIIVAVEAKAAEPDKYLLVPYHYGIQDEDNAKKMNMANLNPSMPEKKMKIANYVKKYNKEILPINVDINIDESSTFVFNLEKDGTAVFTYVFENVSKETAINLSYRADVLYDGEYTMNTYDFTVNDNSQENETAIYHTESNNPVSGTNIIIDELKFEKSEFEITATLTYHYADNSEEMTVDYSDYVDFYFFDPDGKKFEKGPGMSQGITPGENKVFTQIESLAVTDLPEQITLQAESLATQEVLGSIKVYRTDK